MGPGYSVTGVYLDFIDRAARLAVPGQRARDRRENRMATLIRPECPWPG